MKYFFLVPVLALSAGCAIDDQDLGDDEVPLDEEAAFLEYSFQGCTINPLALGVSGASVRARAGYNCSSVGASRKLCVVVKVIGPTSTWFVGEKGTALPSNGSGTAYSAWSSTGMNNAKSCSQNISRNDVQRSLPLEPRVQLG